MQVEAITVTGTTLQQLPRASDRVDAARKDGSKEQPDSEKSSSPNGNGVQPEELLTQIKALTENGLYSVRFENNREFDALIVKVVDTETDEVIRQVPAEELLGVKASLEELRGHIVNTSR